MIKSFGVQNYKALRDVRLDLSPIHVLIGPNNSGKTSMLEACAALCRSVDYELPRAFAGPWTGRALVWHKDPDQDVKLIADCEHEDYQFRYVLSCGFMAAGRHAHVRGEQIALLKEGITHGITHEGQDVSFVCQVARGSAGAPEPVKAAINRVHDSLSGVFSYRFNPRLLSLPVAADATRRFQMDQSGFGLALVLDHILSFDREKFIALESRFRHIFPDVKSIKLLPETAFKAPVNDVTQVPQLQNADGKGIYFEFVGTGQLVSAAQVSDGMLLVLAYLTPLYVPKPPRLLLVEEPENGVHPSLLKGVLSILRDLVHEQTQSQVLLTTHSPYVLDLFQPEEVTLCRNGADGAVSISRLSESETVRKQLDVFGLGEIWTAEGDEKLARTAPTRSGGDQ